MRKTTAVEALGARGDGIAHVDGKPLFVPGVAPGDQLTIENGKVLEVAPGPQRVAARCPHYEQCGGCSLQHISDDTFAQWLSVPIERALAQHGLSAPVRTPHVSPPKTRRRCVLSARWVGRDVLVGFSAERSHAITDVRDCAILLPAL
ncbi:MAG: TRAM domain-containing protein, partial [Pseudomonadota bacterium]